MFSKKKNVEVSSEGEGSCNGLSEQSCWSTRNEVKTGGCTYPFCFVYIFYSPAIFYAVMRAIVGFFFSVANFLLSLTMYHLITFQSFLTFLSYAINSTSIWKKNKKKKKQQHHFFAAVLFLFFFAKRTMVLYNLNMVHLICKAYTKYWGTKRQENSVHADVEVHLPFHSDFILCSVFTLDLFVLSWTWSWPVALVDIIYYDYTRTHMHTCSVQNRGNANQISSFLSLLMNCDCLICLLDDQRSLTNIDSTCRVSRWCFSVMEMPLYFQLLSALFSSLSHFLSWNK